MFVGNLSSGITMPAFLDVFLIYIISWVLPEQGMKAQIQSEVNWLPNSELSGSDWQYFHVTPVAKGYTSYQWSRHQKSKKVIHMGHRTWALKWPFIESTVLVHRKHFSKQKQSSDEMFTYETSPQKYTLSTKMTVCRILKSSTFQ